METRLCIKKECKESTSDETVLDGHDYLDLRHNESTHESITDLETDSHEPDFQSHEDNYIAEQELNEDFNLSITESEHFSDSEDSGPEILEIEPDIKCESNKSNENSHKLLYSVSYFLLFFQLCYKISDRAMKHILNLILSLSY